jgi:hypothetical protein
MKATKYLGQDGQPSGRESNLELLNHEELLTTEALLSPLLNMNIQ